MKLMMIAAGAIALAGAASATAPTEIVVNGAVPTASVRYSDLNLQSDTGRAALSNRIKSAAGQICLDRNIEPVGPTLMRRDCYRAAVASGVGQMDQLLAAGAARNAGGH
jgi:UrcA family protein